MTASRIAKSELQSSRDATNSRSDQRSPARLRNSLDGASRKFAQQEGQQGWGLIQNLVHTPNHSRNATSAVVQTQSLPYTTVSTQRIASLTANNQTSCDAGGAHSNVSASAAFPIQPKLEIGEVDDPYEREADRVSSEVMRTLNQDSGMQVTDRRPTKYQPPTIRRLSHSSNAANRVHVNANFESSVADAQGHGRPLSDSVRLPMEDAFGQDFANVRIHTDQRANSLNDSVHSRAFAVGNDIFIGHADRNRLTSESGQRLLAHELTHVIQQRGSTSLVNHRIQRGGEQSKLMSHSMSDMLRYEIDDGTVTNVFYRSEPLSESDGQEILSRLRRGDPTALRGLTGPAVNEGDIVSGRGEWGLGRVDDEFFIVNGDRRAVDWSDLHNNYEMIAVAHTHPSFGRQLERGSPSFRAIRGGVPLDQPQQGGFRVLPSIDDLNVAFKMKDEARIHTVFTPYRVANDAIRDPTHDDEANLKIEISNVTRSGSGYRADLVFKRGDVVVATANASSNALAGAAPVTITNAVRL